MRPSILSISHQPGRGLVAAGRFACGHTEVNVFPQAARRTSPRELATWMFGPRLDERCARCERRARSTPPDAVCICAGRRPGDLAADDCPALVHVGRAEAWATCR